MDESRLSDGRNGSREMMRYNEGERTAPAFRMFSDDPDAEEGKPKDSMIMEYLLVVLRRRKLILGLALTGIVLSVLLNLRTQSVYQTRTSIEVQVMNSDFMDQRSVTATSGLPSDALLQTQVKLLASDSLMERVKTKLDGEPHSDSVRPNDLLSQLAGLLHLESSKNIPYSKLMDETANTIKVKPMGVSQLIEITCSSWDPRFAAQFCNTLVNEFQEADLESRGTQARHISTWLARQAAEARLKADDAQHRLEVAAGGNGLLLQSQTDSIGQDRLRQMQTEVVRAQADRMEKQAELSEASGAGADSTPDSAAYAASKEKLADLQAQVASLVPPLTEANPKIIHLRAQIAEVQSNMQREKSISVSKLQEGYQAAKHREELLNATYQKLQGTVSTSMQKSSEIEILRREVSSEQQLYQTLLQRSKEAGFASALPASTIRVVDLARAPLVAMFPNRIQSALISAFVGIVVGVILAFILERQAPRLRVPGDIPKYIGLEELGTIPSDSRELQISRSLAASPSAIISLRDGQKADVRKTDSTWRAEALVAESYRSAAFSLLMKDRDRKSRVFVVSSPNAGDGKTTVISNLGIALSKSRLRVVLVDGDLRKSRLHKVLNVENDLGLRNVLSEGVATYQDKLDKVCKSTAYPNLWVMPAGQSDHAVGDLLHSPQLELLLYELESRFDVALIDSPPMLHISDARIIAGSTHRAILVFRSGKTKLSEATAIRNMLQRDQVRISGSVLNDFDPRREGQLKHYDGYYDYYGTGGPKEAQVS